MSSTGRATSAGGRSSLSINGSTPNETPLYINEDASHNVIDERSSPNNDHHYFK